MSADDKTRMSTDIKNTDKHGLLYGELTYRIRGAMFEVHNVLGPGHKESLYQKALAKEFDERKIPFVREKGLDISFKAEKIGVYRPDFIVDEKIVIEVKAVPYLVRNAEVQMSYYLRGTGYELGLLVNFGAKKLDIRRRIYTNPR